MAVGEANDVESAEADRPSGTLATKFETDIRTQRQADGIALGALEAKLSPLDAGELFEGAVIHLYQPGTIGEQFALRLGQAQRLVAQ